MFILSHEIGSNAYIWLDYVSTYIYFFVVVDLDYDFALFRLKKRE